MPKKMTDTGLPKINLNIFSAGEAVDPKNGGQGGFYKSQSMDFRQKASQMTVLPGLYNLANNLPDLMTTMDQDLNGIRYATGNGGYIYSINASNVISVKGKLDSNGGAGCVYNPITDNLYMSSQQTISLYSQLTNTNSATKLLVGQFGKSASIAAAVIYQFNTSSSAYDGGTDANLGISTQRNNLNTLTVTGVTSTTNVTNTLTNTYTVSSTSISEAVGQFCSFVPDIEPFYSIAVYVIAKGSGNMTLTMHDSLNNNLGSATITNGNLVVGWNEFIFASPGIRAIVNSIQSNTLSTGYHFHLTSSVSNDTTTVATIQAQNLTGCNFVLFAYRMVQTKNGWHPMISFGGSLLIGNGNYVSLYNYGNDSAPNNLQYIRHQLFLDQGFETTSIANVGKFAVILAERRSSSNSRQYQGGYVYLWDGVNAAPNDRVPVAMGSPYSAFCVNNIVYFYCAGSLFAYAPGSPTLIKARYIAYQNTDYQGTVDTTICNPNMMTTRYNLLLLGYPSSTTNPNVNYGIYSWGSVELLYPNSFGYSYVLASGIQNYSQANNLQIGMVKNFVDTMYVSSSYTDSNGTHNSLDVLDNTSSVAPTFNWSSLIWDGGARYKMKKGLRVKISFLPLPTGTTITPWISIDRGAQISADPVTNTSYQVGAGATNALINLSGARSHELEWGFTGTATNGTVVSPTITGVTAEIDSLDDEPDLRADG
jgi:hypothetical protein